MSLLNEFCQLDRYTVSNSVVITHKCHAQIQLLNQKKRNLTLRFLAMFGPVKLKRTQKTETTHVQEKPSIQAVVTGKLLRLIRSICGILSWRPTTHVTRA